MTENDKQVRIPDYGDWVTLRHGPEGQVCGRVVRSWWSVERQRVELRVGLRRAHWMPNVVEVPLDDVLQGTPPCH